MKPVSMTIRECLESLGISSLGDWDVLVFLHRRRASLASAEQIARLVGYSSKVVGAALDKLESQKIIRRSRSSQGVRLYQFVPSETHLAAGSCFQQIMSLAENRSGRLQVVKVLRENSGLQIVASGETL